jgi:hypothetical protein
MIFVGDIAHPFPEPPQWHSTRWPWSAEQKLVANLEGALVLDNEQAISMHRGLFNHISVVEALVSANVRAVSIANNHTMDVPGALPGTCTALQNEGTGFTGAGKTLAHARLPASVTEQNKTWIFLAAGWETIQCRPSRS